MAKRQYIDYKKLQSELFTRTEGYAANVGAVYRAALTQIINLVKGTELEAGKPFSFSDYGYSDEVTPILRTMYSRIYQIIRNGVEKEWLTANEHNDGLVKAIFGKHSIEDNHFARFFQRNMEAMNAFFARKTASGLNLSQKVWKYTGIYKDELEDALDLAIGEGTPANRLATQIQKYLNDPDRFYRRFRVKIGENEDGTPIYGRIWKRRVFDAETGSYKWVDDDPRKYHPGRGVYRSSYRNAQRLARTETNIAYRTADYERWQQMDFVIGIEIKLSNNHPCADICDDLKGVYPKNFKWSGWHPNCRCYQEPVLASPAEVDKMLDKILDGESPASVPTEGKVSELPTQFTSWISDNEGRIKNATDNGTLPYFLRDNQKVINPPSPLERAKERHAARTDEDVAAIKKAWNDRRATRKYGKSILDYMSGISDVDVSALAHALNGGDWDVILKEAKALRDIGKHILSLDKLDNPIEVARMFSMADAEAVNNAVAAKLQSWATLPLEQQAKKLKFEAYDFLGGNMKGVQSKYATWQVSQAAYIKELERVNDLIEWQAIKSEFATASAFTTKSKPYKDLVSALDNAIAAHDKAAAQQALHEIQTKRSQLEAAAIKRAQKKSDVSFGAKDLTQARKDAAKWFIHADDATDYFFDNATDCWRLASAAEKEAMWRYTAGSSYITEPLRAIPGYYHYYSDRLLTTQQHIADMTNYIARSTFKDDVWVKRDEITAFMEYRFKLPQNLSAYESDPSKLVGMVGRDESFMSCGNCRNTNFGSKPVCLNIYCPKGTRATYAEPFSEFGLSHNNGVHCPGKNWDGVSKPTSTHENEIILQRGTQFRITKAEFTGGKWYIDLEVIAQNPRAIKQMVNTASGYYCELE